MKFKSIFLIIFLLIITNFTIAQVPNYVPTSGLVGWWPFNGNANDQSGNGNNGTVNGPTLTSNRFGNPNKAYSFNGSGNITIPDANSLSFPNKQFSFSFWSYFNIGANSADDVCILGKRQFIGGPFEYYFAQIKATHPNNPNIFVPYLWDLNGNCNWYSWYLGNFNFPIIVSGQWEHYVYTGDGLNDKVYKNGQLIFSSVVNNLCVAGNTSGNLLFGEGGGWNNTQYMNGKLDDIGIWNRALTQQEITDLYNSSNCLNNTTINSQTNFLQTGSTAFFIASTLEPNPTFVWQSDFGQGFQTLSNFRNYSGVNTDTLSISNIQISEHNQPFRVITTSNDCVDTSNVVVLNIADTCIVIVYDTLLTTVTDTLIINTQISGANPPNNLNALKVFPNPASTHITIDFGNFSVMTGYTLTIVNLLGQTVFTTPINQQISHIDLSTWTGNGIYFVQLNDLQNNLIANRKIVIQ